MNLLSSAPPWPRIYGLFVVFCLTQAFAVEFSTSVLQNVRPQKNYIDVAADGIKVSKHSQLVRKNQEVKRTPDPMTCGKLDPNVKFYIYDLSSSLNYDLLQCYKNMTGTEIYDDFREEKGQNTADIWLHKLLENHSSRTWNQTEAKFFYIPFYGFLSSFFSDLKGESPAGPDFSAKTACNGKSHMDRVNELAAFLANQWTFQQHPERHMMTVSFWAVAQNTANNPNPSSPPCVVVGDLFAKLQKSVLLVYEQKFSSMEKVDEHKNWWGPLVSIPYVPKPTLAANEPDAAFGHRDITFFFQGSLHSAFQNGGGLKARQELAAAFENQPGSLIVDTYKHYTGNSYERGMSRSSFCLVLEGDTPTSARLFDSLAAGCVPLILSDDITLPFASQLNWTEFSVHPHTGAYRSSQGSNKSQGSLLVVESLSRPGSHSTMEMQAAVAKRIAMLKRTPNEKLQHLQQALLRVRKNFIYGIGSPFNFTTSGGAGTLVDCALQEVVKQMHIDASTTWWT